MSVKKVKVPWRAWYGDKDYKLTFPEEWDIRVFEHQGARELTRRDIEAGIDAPMGSPMNWPRDAVASRSPWTTSHGLRLLQGCCRR